VGLVSQFELALRHAVAPVILRVDDGDDHVVCRVEQLDSIGAAVVELRLETPRLGNLAPDALSQRANQIAARLNYLLEPVAPIEVDTDRCTVQLRSHPPRKSESSTSYYEVLVAAGGSIALVRYDKAKSEPRQRIPMLLTREVLVRLLGDFDAAS
jgi:hypothetical protein